MKRKLLGMFALMLMVPLAVMLTACGGKDGKDGAMDSMYVTNLDVTKTANSITVTFDRSPTEVDYYDVSIKDWDGNSLGGERLFWETDYDKGYTFTKSGLESGTYYTITIKSVKFLDDDVDPARNSSVHYSPIEIVVRTAE